MKLIKPSFEIIEQAPGLEGLYKHIELCGRVCYKSENLITKDSAKNFVDKICKAKHGSVLEHGTIYLKKDITDFTDIDKAVEFTQFYCRNPYSKCSVLQNKYEIITTNYRVLKENNRLDDLKYLCKPTEHHEKRISVKFICSRAISHELVRHRTFSFSQESQRYCNYNKDKFGNEITFIKPLWLDKFSTKLLNDEGYRPDGTSDVFISDDYRAFLQNCENIYILSTIAGAKPEEAREVLPNSTKTELIMTGFVSDWIEFFKLRTAENAHPEMRRLTIYLKEEFIKRGYVTE